MRTIYNTQVQIKSQKQADNMLRLCKEFKLNYWNNEIAFKFTGDSDFFTSHPLDEQFGLFDYNNSKEEISEFEFLKILIDYNK